MKKLLVVLIAILGFAISTNAQNAGPVNMTQTAQVKVEGNKDYYVTGKISGGTGHWQLHIKAHGFSEGQVSYVLNVIGSDGANKSAYRTTQATVVPISNGKYIGEAMIPFDSGNMPGDFHVYRINRFILVNPVVKE